MRVVGRYTLHDEIASGGMATVYLGSLNGPVGFSRTVAIKRPHPQFAKDPELVSMFLDEARLAARIIHRNVVSTIDVVSSDDEVLLVMEYVPGESLARLGRVLRQAGERVPTAIACAIMSDVLHGLHAAHEATSDKGEPLQIVHRDVSPHNILVGRDGTTRVLDFGIAKAAARIQTTREGSLKGKLSYMAPEQLSRRPVDRRADVFAASIVLWEMLTGKKLFDGEDEAAIVANVLYEPIDRASSHADVLPALDAIVSRGLERNAAARFGTAAEMARAIAEAAPVARVAEVAEWVERVGGEGLVERERLASLIEGDAAATIVDRAAEEATSATLSVAVPAAALRAEAHPSRASPRLRIATIAGLVVALSAVFGWRMESRRGEPPVAPVVATASDESEDPPAPAEAPTLPTVAASSPPVTTPVGRAVRRVPTTRASSRPNCNPNYVFDEAGLKHFKRECL